MEKTGEFMRRNVRNLSLMILLSIMLVAPVLGNPNGPPWDSGGNLVIETGCTCHGGGAPSTEVVVSVSGVPRAYNVSETYTFTIGLQHASNDGGGFLFWDGGIGTLVPGEGSQTVACLLYTSPSPRDGLLSRMPSSA